MRSLLFDQFCKCKTSTFLPKYRATAAPTVKYCQIQICEWDKTMRLRQRPENQAFLGRVDEPLKKPGQAVDDLETEFRVE
jgi:hypothetical protein